MTLGSMLTLPQGSHAIAIGNILKMILLHFGAMKFGPHAQFQELE